MTWKSGMSRYSIWGRQHGVDHDTELARCETNPQAIVDGLKAKSVIAHVITTGGKRVQVPKYSWLRIVDHEPEEANG
jgi:hypothetical protein